MAAGLLAAGVLAALAFIAVALNPSHYSPFVPDDINSRWSPDMGWEEDAWTTTSTTAPTASATPPAKATPTAKPSPANSLTSLLVDKTNEARTKRTECGGYPSIERWANPQFYGPYTAPLLIDLKLMASAQTHAEYMAETGDYRHQELRAIFSAGGQSENIAWLGGITTYDGRGRVLSAEPRPSSEIPGDFVDAWIASPGHCHNLMQPQWGRIGVGIALADDHRYYGVQVFGR